MDTEKSKLQGSVEKKILEFKKTFGRPYILIPCVLRGGEEGGNNKGLCGPYMAEKFNICTYITTFFFGGVGGREGYEVYTSPKKPKIALITDHLPADLSPDASADAPPRINIR